MTIDLTGISSWVWIILALVIVFVIFRFFFHIVVRIFQFILRFFWHGCIAVVVILVIYIILRALHIF